MNDNVFPIFPTTVLQSSFGRELSPNEIEFARKHSTNTIKNKGNVRSVDSKVLEYDELKDIRNFITSKIQYYIREILLFPDNLDLYITQSWMNYTEPGQTHHLHIHPNSYLSGVFYFHAEGESDKITFQKRVTAQEEIFTIGLKDNNYYNSCSWWFPAITGNLFLFPSSLHHMVEETKSSETRISLAFNTFFRGNLGSEIEANQLIL